MLPLIAAGLGTLAKAAVTAAGAKAGDWIKEKTGVDVNEYMDGKQAIPPEIQQQLMQYQLEHEEELARLAKEWDVAQMDARTERHKTDMLSDSWLSKNIRPLAFGTVVLLFCYAIADESIDQTKTEMVKDVVIWFGSFYFTLRTVFDKRYKSNAPADTIGGIPAEAIKSLKSYFKRG
jgi:hypothetical protein